MAILSPAQYDALERAIADGRRIAVSRRNSHDLTIVPQALRLVGGRERIEALHPTTGYPLHLWLDDLTGFEVVR